MFMYVPRFIARRKHNINVNNTWFDAQNSTRKVAFKVLFDFNLLRVFPVTFYTEDAKEKFIIAHRRRGERDGERIHSANNIAREDFSLYTPFDASSEQPCRICIYFDENANAWHEISERRKSKGRRPVLVSARRGDGEAGGEGRRLRDESGPRDEEHRRWQQSAVSHAADTTHAAHTAHAAHAPHADIGDSASTPAAGLDRLRPRTGEFFIFAYPASDGTDPSSPHSPRFPRVLLPSSSPASPPSYLRTHYDRAECYFILYLVS